MRLILDIQAEKNSSTREISMRRAPWSERTLGIWGQTGERLPFFFWDDPSKNNSEWTDHQDEGFNLILNSTHSWKLFCDYKFLSIIINSFTRWKNITKQWIWLFCATLKLCCDWKQYNQVQAFSAISGVYESDLWNYACQQTNKNSFSRDDFFPTSEKKEPIVLNPQHLNSTKEI